MKIFTVRRSRAGRNVGQDRQSRDHSETTKSPGDYDGLLIDFQMPSCCERDSISSSVRVKETDRVVIVN